MLIAKELCKSYDQYMIINDVNLRINKGEMVAIMGPSGAGKTTLLYLLSSLEKPDSGFVEIDGIDLSKLQGKTLAEFRNKKVGFVFQFHNLLPEFTLFENICIPGYIGGCAKKEVEKKANELLCLLGIDHRNNHLPSEISGGERQRAAVARALINSPSIVFADEPSGSLDLKNASMLHEVFLHLCKSFKQTFVFVTHNQSLAAIADRICTLQDGVIQSP
ncbi:ABC transporter ATP-binding protein [Cardinium endosymbiont of Culicoides punctatus]|uniref:ABC transporter ATP-binding protein n=1 Tax=Cardinium endosymbiont of Culicoides punctatus TaxID=2304601 RepID=UPI0010591C94|nr:ABC transporter ATP-binding protein [Cardinium endosymbiont of Culicoides punctatus]TDG95604.1 Lipoprotein-releasing system ATP-binding protein LolD [Cardinium endosymbiont of Culicoides punctatus]